MPHSFGSRARTRDMFSRPFRQRGMIKMSTYMTQYKLGDYVDIKCNPAQVKGMPFKHYHGRTGQVYNVTKRAVGVRVAKQVNGRIINKHLNVRVEQDPLEVPRRPQGPRGAERGAQEGGARGRRARGAQAATGAAQGRLHDRAARGGHDDPAHPLLGPLLRRRG